MDYPLAETRRDSPVHFPISNYFSTVYSHIPPTNDSGPFNETEKHTKHNSDTTTTEYPHKPPPKSKNRTKRNRRSYLTSDYSIKKNANRRAQNKQENTAKPPTYFDSSKVKTNTQNQPQSFDYPTQTMYSNSSFTYQTNVSTEPCPKHPTIRQHCRYFCETTSLRGIPRIFKSSNSKQKFLWSFFVLLFFIACLTCIGLLIVQYRAYDVIHQPKTLYNKTRAFPSLTICNLRPFTPQGYELLKQHGILYPKDYELRQRRSAYKFKDRLSKEQKRLITVSWNLDSYLSSLPSYINSTDLGHLLNDMIIDCSITYQDGIFSSARYCNMAGKWVSIQNRLFHNCYTYSINEEYLNRTMVLNLIVYLNNEESVQCLDCADRIAETQLTGAYLNLHSHNTYPDTESEGLKILPGTMTVIKFIPREWSMMEPPHGKCDKKVRQTISFDNKIYRYSEKACMRLLYQQELLNKCGCVNFHQVPTELLWAKKQGKICRFLYTPVLKNETNFKFDWGTMVNYMNSTKCGLNISQSIGFDKCRSECTYFTYDTSISFAQWPVKSYHPNYVKTVNDTIRKLIRRNSHDKDRIKSLKKFYQKLKPYEKIFNTKDPTESLKLLNSFNFIEKNLLSVQVHRNNFDITLVEEKAVISLTSFLSQAGGLCSIWSGITFVCIVEIFELLIMVFETVFWRNKTN